MPILNVKLSAQPSPELSAAVAEMLTECTARILHKDPRVTAVVVDYVSPAD
ncbi:MAG: tautomerase family protein [Rhodocyclaceae bacterium]|nr:tautomerase family protein [Rhodocyclaceae bacterium]